MLEDARQAVKQMWLSVAPKIVMADGNDTLHFIHEEASEVAKVAMQLGLIGRHTYTRSAEVRAKEYTIADLVVEIGDVLLMALTLAQAFDVDPGVCLQESLDKFYTRAGAAVKTFHGSPPGAPHDHQCRL